MSKRMNERLKVFHKLRGDNGYGPHVFSFEEVDEVGALLSELEGTDFFKPLMDALPEYEREGSLYPLEKVLDEIALSVGWQTAIKQPYGAAPILGYLSQKDTEVRNIRAISRAKEAGIAPDKIRGLVLNPAG